MEVAPCYKPALGGHPARTPVAHDGALEGLRPGAERQAAARHPALLDTQRQQDAVDRLSRSMRQVSQHFTLPHGGLLLAGT